VSTADHGADVAAQQAERDVPAISSESTPVEETLAEHKSFLVAAQDANLRHIDDQPSALSEVPVTAPGRVQEPDALPANAAAQPVPSPLAQAEPQNVPGFQAPDTMDGPTLLLGGGNLESTPEVSLPPRRARSVTFNEVTTDLVQQTSRTWRGSGSVSTPPELHRATGAQLDCVLHSPMSVDDAENMSDGSPLIAEGRAGPECRRAQDGSFLELPASICMPEEDHGARANIARQRTPLSPLKGQTAGPYTTNVVHVGPVAAMPQQHGSGLPNAVLTNSTPTFVRKRARTKRAKLAILHSSPSMPGPEQL
jgi:hypothetical protein